MSQYPNQIEKEKAKQRDTDREGKRTGYTAMPIEYHPKMEDKQREGNH
jgi:hypothetical protein